MSKGTIEEVRGRSLVVCVCVSAYRLSYVCACVCDSS